MSLRGPNKVPYSFDVFPYAKEMENATRCVFVVFGIFETPADGRWQDSFFLGYTENLESALADTRLSACLVRNTATHVALHSVNSEEEGYVVYQALRGLQGVCNRQLGR